jgi:TPR repeat protein
MVMINRTKPKRRFRVRFTKAFWAIVILIASSIIYHYYDLQSTISRLEVAAQKNDVMAQRSLGIGYMLGGDLSKDITKARLLLSKAASKNDPVAQYFLGVLDLEGTGVYKANEEKGWKNIELAAEGNFPLSYLKLAMREIVFVCSFMSREEKISGDVLSNIKEKYRLIAVLLERANKAKKSHSLLFLDHSKDLKNLFYTTKRKLADFVEREYMQPNLLFGFLDLDGSNPFRNVKRGIATLEMYKHFAEAVYFLGKVYKKGKVVEKNIDKAEELYREGVARNDPMSHYLLGKLLYKERGSFKEAKNCLKKAERKEIPSANFVLGKIYFERNKGRKDIEKARGYFLKASAVNITKADAYLDKIGWRSV